MKEQTIQNKCEFYCYRNTRGPINSKNNKVGKIELVAFDMDGVLTDIISSWKYVHDYFNTSNDKSVADYLEGKIDDAEFIKRDADLWKENGRPIKRQKLVEILADVPLMKGAEDTIRFLKNNGIQTAIVSAGLDVLADRVAKDLDMNYVYSNGIKSDKDGYLNGEAIIGVRLMYKDKAIEELSKDSRVSLNNIITIGNSCFDIPMFEVSGLGIAFNPEDDCVCDAADFVIKDNNLTNILRLFEK